MSAAKPSLLHFFAFTVSLLPQCQVISVSLHGCCPSHTVSSSFPIKLQASGEAPSPPVQVCHRPVQSKQADTSVTPGWSRQRPEGRAEPVPLLSRDLRTWAQGAEGGAGLLLLPPGSYVPASGLEDLQRGDKATLEVI